MTTSDSGGAPWRFILIQVVILGGILLFFKFYLPHHERKLAAERVAQREQRIAEFIKENVVENSARQVSVPLDGTIVTRHPQKLRAIASPENIEAELGVPNTSTVDFQGGQHLTWVGTSHKVDAAFNKGRLYCVTWEDLPTHRGAFVYESEELWHPY